jgi:hypothetical protein
MAKPNKKHFAFAVKEALQAGSEGEEVRNLQTLLCSFGYLRGAYQPSTFDRATAHAVRRYQRFYGLAVDGVVGDQTKSHIVHPRCGVPDLPLTPMVASPNAPFVLRGCSYDRREFTYAFVNQTGDLPLDRQREIIREAFGAWATVADLSFTEVGVTDNPDFPIGWHQGIHGDGSPFDEMGGPTGNTLAHAFFPPPCGGIHAGAMHFDDSETWIDDPQDAGIRLLQVAIHEIGHLLGLSHSSDTSAIMFALYSPDRVTLSADDVAGISALYGARDGIPRLSVPALVSGNLGGSGESASYLLRTPGPVSLTVDGPDQVDFDVYVRRNLAPTPGEWDFSALTIAADERLSLPPAGGDTYFVMVRSFRGAGNFNLRVEPLVS